MGGGGSWHKHIKEISLLTCKVPTKAFFGKKCPKKCRIHCHTSYDVLKAHNVNYLV